MTSAKTQTTIVATRAGWKWAVGAVLVIAALVTVGVIPKINRAARVEEQHQRALGPMRVLVGKAAKGASSLEMTLPGTVTPLQSSVMYARGAGYVRKFTADLGDEVKIGQVLAEIESPEVDEDVKRARARFDEAEKNVQLTRGISERAERLAKEGVSSQQQAEESRSRLNSAAAQVDAARADLDRLGALRGFSKVTAGINGVVTKRLVELGTLVSPGITPLFELAQIETLKVTLDVPQSAAPSVRIGGLADVFLPSAPQKKWVAKVSRTAGALDAASRTLRTELTLENDGQLLAGSYVQVRFKVELPNAPLVIPASALSVRADGPKVWVAENGVLGQHTVQLGRDLGKELEVVGGISEGTLVVLNPTDALVVGAKVDAVEAAARAK